MQLNLITRMSLKSALVLSVFTALVTVILAMTYSGTLARIKASKDEAVLVQIRGVLPSDAYDNDILSEQGLLSTIAGNGKAIEMPVWRARLQGRVSAWVFDVVTYDGYAGSIRLLVAIARTGEVLRVRVLEHKETPGLGDYIDIQHDRNKAHFWIDQFVGRRLSDVAHDDAKASSGVVNIASHLLDKGLALSALQWKVKKDGGVFDAVAGATISARAVTGAVRRTVLFAAAHQDTLLSEGAFVHVKK